MIRCPKCRAGRANLVLQDRYLASGDRVQDIVCRLCGRIIASRTLLVPGTSRPVVILPGSDRRVGKKKLEQVPCAVPGCGKTHTGLAKWPICLAHRLRLDGWICSKTHRAAAPVQFVNGVWIERGMPLPGIPGEGTAAAPVQAVEPPRAGQRKRSPRASRQQDRPAVMPPDIQRLARLGHSSAARLLDLMNQ